MIGSRRDVIQWLQNQKHDMFEVREYSPKRSLTANDYYWKTLTELAHVLHCTTAYLHNRFLRECAPPATMGGRVVYTFLPDTAQAMHEAEESTTFHIKPTSQIRPGKNGTDYRAYIVLKGSSEFNSKEMGALIDRAVEACKDCDIAPPPTAAIQATLEKMARKEERAKG